jgi:hypothetical protein
VNCLPTPRENQIKHGPILAGVDTGVAGVDMVGRTYGASLFGRMTTYINLFMAITPCYPGGKLQYCNFTVQ